MADVWEGKKMILGKPVSFTSYSLKNGILRRRRGILNITETQIQLYRVVDVSLKQDFVDILVNQGTIILHSNSKYDNLTLENVKNPREVRDLLNEQIEKYRRLQNVHSNETVINDCDDMQDYRYPGDNFR